MDIFELLDKLMDLTWPGTGGMSSARKSEQGKSVRENPAREADDAGSAETGSRGPEGLG